LNFGFSVFNKSDSFNKVINENPFLKYSYNTALVTGMAVSFAKVYNGFKHPKSLSKELSVRINAEESGLTWGLLPIFKKYKRRYLKTDIELKHTVKYNRSSLVCRGFLGIGIPLLGSDTNKALPFFKQYFGGGSNSMRAWPVRGIGRGGDPLVPFSSNKRIFNDRTGDAQLEFNAEYRFDIAKIIPNTLTLRGAVFTDVGNVWNIRNTKLDGSLDSSQFRLKNLYKQLGVAAGTGFRLDFNYFVLRFDMGFRFKRPDLFYKNDGWKAPDIGLNDFVKKILTRGPNDEYRRWRYENFNFTFGIGYSF
jgi:outer membrane protein assembly factor BamA